MLREAPFRNLKCFPVWCSDVQLDSKAGPRRLRPWPWCPLLRASPVSLSWKMRALVGRALCGKTKQGRVSLPRPFVVVVVDRLVRCYFEWWGSGRDERYADSVVARRGVLHQAKPPLHPAGKCMYDRRMRVFLPIIHLPTYRPCPVSVLCRLLLPLASSCCRVCSVVVIQPCVST